MTSIGLTATRACDVQVYALFVSSPTKTFKANKSNMREMIESFRMI